MNVSMIHRCAPLAVAGALLLGAGLPAHAQQTTAPVPPPLPRIDYVVKDKDFQILAEPRRDESGQTDVLVFFWYGSPWSARIEPLLRAWVEQGRAPPNVRVRFIPLVNQPEWAFAARVFYAFERMGIERQMTPRLLRAVQAGAVNLQSPSSMSQWLAAQGVSVKAFQAAINHPLVIARVSGLPAIARAYEVRSTPTFVIDGRYHIAATDRTPPERATAVALFMAQKLSQGGPRP